MVKRVSNASQNRWVPYNDDVEAAVLRDFRSLWNTGFLDDLLIEVRDVRFENGVIGKVIVFDMEERQRIKIVDYVGTQKVDQSAIEEELKTRGVTVRLDQFIDQVGSTEPVADVHVGERDDSPVDQDGEHPGVVGVEEDRARQLSERNGGDIEPSRHQARH